jgi:hypothetical protein
MGESNILGISVRALLAFILVWTVCWMQSNGIKVEEPLYTLCVMAVSFYLGTKNNQQQGVKHDKDISSTN